MFHPLSNTCITPFGELGLFLLEMKVVTKLLILGTTYEEDVPMESHFQSL